MINMSEIESRYYTPTKLQDILVDAGCKPNSFKQAKVIIELVPNGWLYGVCGYSKRTNIMTVLVKGMATESGSEYLNNLCEYPLKVKVLDEPIPHDTLYTMWK